MAERARCGTTFKTCSAAVYFVLHVGPRLKAIHEYRHVSRGNMNSLHRVSDGGTTTTLRAAFSQRSPHSAASYINITSKIYLFGGRTTSKSPFAKSGQIQRRERLRLRARYIEHAIYRNFYFTYVVLVDSSSYR